MSTDLTHSVGTLGGFIDILMLSPLMGSSQTTGGIFRGCAQGNIPNHADLSTVDIEFEVPVKGEVYLCLTDQYPHHVKFEFLRGESDLVVMVNVAESMAPILDMIAHKFSPIKCMYNLFIIYFC